MSPGAAAPAERPLVRAGHAQGLRPPFAHEATRVRRRRVRRPAGHRDPQHLVRHQPLPRALPRSGAEAVKRGVWQAGGFPARVPGPTLSETFQKPTPMLYRNLLAMETEELLRSYPVDGAVLMGGCDKSTPGLLMGAARPALPSVFVPGGADAAGTLARRGPRRPAPTCGSTGTSTARATSADCELSELESGLARSPGHCMTMGTASTLTAAAEALGVTLPGASSIPAVDSGHERMAAASGRRIVELVREDLKLSEILTRAAFEDAVSPRCSASAAPPTPSSI